MKSQPAGIDGSLLIELTRIGDERGFFARIWDEAWGAELGMDVRNVQTNVSYSRHRGTIRGLHYQVRHTLSRSCSGARGEPSSMSRSTCARIRPRTVDGRAT